jgi:hypothetical protein
LREGQNAPVGFLFGTLRDSHDSRLSKEGGFVVRGALRVTP